MGRQVSLVPALIFLDGATQKAQNPLVLGVCLVLHDEYLDSLRLLDLKDIGLPLGNPGPYKLIGGRPCFETREAPLRPQTGNGAP